MKTVTFKSGEIFTTNLEPAEIMKRMNRLSWLIVEMEERTENESYRRIYEKAVRAYNKKNGFTGIIRLTNYEKEMLDYLDEDMMPEKELEAIRFYKS